MLANPFPVTNNGPAFNPIEHNASEVRAYLERVRDTDASEYERVAAAERNGANRKTAIPA